MRKLLLILAVQTSAACATLHLAPDERRELPGSEDVVPGSPGGDVGATVSGWYARSVLEEPFDPLRPVFYSAKVRGTLRAHTFCIDSNASDCLSDNGATTGILTSGAFSIGTTLSIRNASAALSLGTASTQNFSIDVNGTATSNAGSGVNGFALATNGARIDFGAGASDYASSDGTTVTFAGPLASVSGVTAASGTFHAAAGSGGLLIKDDTNNQTFTQLVNNLVWDLYNNSTQKLVEANTNGTVGVCAGTPASSSTLATVGGQLSVITADVTSSGASNLISYTMPANVLVTTNRCVRIVGWGTALNNANAKTVALDFGSQTVITKQLNISIASTTWKVQAVVCRSGSNTQDIYAEAWNPMGTTVSSVDGATVLYQAARTAGTQTETATITIKGKTTTATTTDVTMDGLTVEYL